MNEIHGALCNVSFITCIIIPTGGHGIQAHIEFCSNVIQASDTTSDKEVANLESLLAALRDSWKAIWNGAKLVSSSLQIEAKCLGTVVPLGDNDSMMRMHLIKI